MSFLFSNPEIQILTIQHFRCQAIIPITDKKPRKNTAFPKLEIPLKKFVVFLMSSYLQSMADRENENAFPLILISKKPEAKAVLHKFGLFQFKESQIEDFILTANQSKAKNWNVIVKSLKATEVSVHETKHSASVEVPTLIRERSKTPKLQEMKKKTHEEHETDCDQQESKKQKSEETDEWSESLSFFMIFEKY